MSKQTIISDINTKIIGATEVESITPEVVGDILVDIVNEIPAGGGLQSTLDLGPSATFQTDLGSGASSTASTYIGASGFNYNRSECGGLYTKESKITSGEYGPETSYKQFDYQSACNYSKGVIGFSGAFPSMEAYRNSCSNISRFGFNAPTGDNSFRIPAPNTNCTTYNIPISVNGCKADIYGNINVSSCVPTPGLNSVLTISDIACNKAITFSYSDGSCGIIGSVVAFYGSNDSQSAVYGAGNFSLACDGNSLSLGTTGFTYYRSSTQTTIGVNYPTVGDGSVRTLPLSVNGNFADAAGNIIVTSGGGSTPGINEVLAVENTVTDYSIKIESGESADVATIQNNSIFIIGPGGASGVSIGTDAWDFGDGVIPVGSLNLTSPATIGSRNATIIANPNSVGNNNFFITPLGSEDGTAKTLATTDQLCIPFLEWNDTLKTVWNKSKGTASTSFGKDAACYSQGTSWTAIGDSAGKYSSFNGYWTAIGKDAGLEQSSGNNWTAVGFQAGYYSNSGSNWTAIGSGAGYGNIQGSNWVALGSDAGRFSCSTGDAGMCYDQSIYIGNCTLVSATGVVNENVFGFHAQGMGSNTQVFGNGAITDTYIAGTLHSTLSGNIPSTATANGKEGEIRIGEDHIYIAVAENTWKRSALTTW